MTKRGIAALALGLVVVVGCGQPAPSRSPRPIPTATPAPSTSATLRVSGPVEWCGSFGGCAYFAELLGPDQTWQAELEVAEQDGGVAISGQNGLPSSLPAGPYAVQAWFNTVSDDGGAMGPLRGSCATAFRVSPGQTDVDVQVSFGWDTCEATVGGTPD